MRPLPSIPQATLAPVAGKAPGASARARTAAAASLALALGALAACSTDLKTEVTGRSETKSGSASDVSGNGNGNGSGTGADAGPAGGPDEVVAPSQVTGIYLACAYVPDASPDATTEANYITVGCALRDKDGKNVDTKGQPIDLQFVLDASGQPVSIVTEAQPANAAWQVVARMPRDLWTSGHITATAPGDGSATAAAHFDLVTNAVQGSLPPSLSGGSGTGSTPPKSSTATTLTSLPTDEIVRNPASMASTTPTVYPSSYCNANGLMGYQPVPTPEPTALPTGSAGTLQGGAVVLGPATLTPGPDLCFRKIGVVNATGGTTVTGRVATGITTRCLFVATRTDIRVIDPAKHPDVDLTEASVGAFADAYPCP